MTKQVSLRPFSIRLCACFALVLASAAVAQPTAHFELRLAPGQGDSVLVLGNPADDTLNLEVWVEVTGAAVPVWAVSMFLKTSEDNVITFDENYLAVPFVSFPCVYNGTNNTPFLGDFSPACFEPTGIMAGVGAPALYGTFSVTAVGEGSASYIFDGSDPDVRQWKVSLADMTDITGANLSFSIDPAVASIDVLTIIPSPDADDDGDVDLDDFHALQTCAATSNGMSTNGPCPALDLNADGTVGEADMPMFTTAITGPIGPADVEGDHDVDLADFGRFQICMTKSGQAGMDVFCDRADVDRDHDVDMNDYALFADNIAGPRH